MTRKRIELTDSVMDVLMNMSEGNPGAITVLAEMLNRDGLMDILTLDDMNIRGSQIWLGFKDFAGEDMDVFMAAIKERSQDMVNKINEMSGPGEQAVRSGASFTR